MTDYALRIKQAATPVDAAREIFRVKAQALLRAADRLDEQFNKAVDAVLATRGRFVIAGVGKSGHVGSKMAATLASTGTPSFFMHPTEAFHGDLGMVKGIDTVLLISYSGETEEVVRLLPALKRLGVTIIAMTGQAASTLAREADIHLDVNVPREVCPHNLAPTTSTTLTIAMGDALAVALMTARDFKPEDFAERHPGGSLGRRLLNRARDLMRGKDLPVVAPTAPFSDVLNSMTAGRLGLTVVVDHGRIAGVISDGDLRRVMQAHANPTSLKAADMMTSNPVIVQPDDLVSLALEQMRERRVKSVLVSGDGAALDGILDMHDC